MACKPYSITTSEDARVIFSHETYCSKTGAIFVCDLTGPTAASSLIKIEPHSGEGGQKKIPKTEPRGFWMLPLLFQSNLLRGQRTRPILDSHAATHLQTKVTLSLECFLFFFSKQRTKNICSFKSALTLVIKEQMYFF